MSATKVQDIFLKLKETWLHIFSIMIYSLNDEPATLQYKNVKMIGNGTFGVVVQIEDMITKRKYALKKVWQDSKFYNRELEIFKKIKHDNIVKLHYYCYTEEDNSGKFLNLFMDFLPHDLESLIFSKKVNYKNYIKSWVVQLIAALDYLHKMNICHRDIKPSNILVNKNLNKIVICDMGSAKVMEKGKKNLSYICSRFYRSPENLLGIESYDCKIDIWSAGCIFVECHTGRTLFKGSSSTDMINNILEVVTCSESDLLEMNIHVQNFKPKNLRDFLSKEILDLDLIKLYEKMLVINPTKRASARYLQNYINRNKKMF